MTVILSNCCKADVRVEGDTTQYYVCSKCGQACDARLIALLEIPPMKNKINAIIADLNKLDHEIDQIHEQVDHESLALKMALACLQASVYTASIAATNVLGHVKNET